MIDLKEWDKLDKTLKEIITQGAAAMNTQVLSQFQAQNNEALGKLLNEHSIKLKPYSEELLNAIGKRATEVLPEIASRSADAKTLFNHIVNFRKGMLSWSAYSEASFLGARTVADFKTV